MAEIPLTVAENSHEAVLQADQVLVINAVSPKVNLERTDDGLIISVIDYRGGQTGKVFDGEKGEPGKDYVLTNTDKQVIANIVAKDINVPRKVSDLENDAGYIVAETDPTVPSWAKTETKPTYTAYEVGALPENTVTENATTTLKQTTQPIVIVKKDDTVFGSNDPMMYSTQARRTNGGVTRDDGSVVFPLAGLSSLPASNAPRRKLMALIRSWIGRTNFVHTTNGVPDYTTLFGADCEADENNKFHADCSSYVCSLLMGITYDCSRYVRGKTNKNITYMDGSMVFPPSKYEARSQGGLYTFELAEFFAQQKRLFTKPKNAAVAYNVLRFGDIGFSMDSNDSHYYGIAHTYFILGVVDDQLIVTQCNSSPADRVEPSVIHWRLYPLSGLQFFARPNYGFDNFRSYATRKANGAFVLRSDILTPGVEILLDNSGTNPDNLAGMTQKSLKFSACVDYIPVIPGSTIAFTGSVSNARGNYAARIHEYTEAYAPVKRGSTILVGGTRYGLTLDASTRYIRPSFGWLNSAGNSLYFADMDGFEVTVTPSSS